MLLNGGNFFVNGVQRYGEGIVVSVESKESKLERLSHDFVKNIMQFIGGIESRCPGCKSVMDDFVDYIGIKGGDIIGMKNMRDSVVNDYMPRMEKIRKHGDLIPQILYFYIESHKNDLEDCILFDQRVKELSVLYRYVLYLDLYGYIFKKVDGKREEGSNAQEELMQGKSPLQLLLQLPSFENMTYPSVSKFLQEINSPQRMAVKNTDKNLIIQIIDCCIRLSRLKIQPSSKGLFVSGRSKNIQDSTELEYCLHGLKEGIEDILNEAKGFIKNEENKHKKIKEQIEGREKIQKELLMKERQDEINREQEAKKLEAEQQKAKNARKIEEKKRKDAEVLGRYDELDRVFNSAQERLNQLNKNFSNLKKEGKKPSQKQRQNMQEAKDSLAFYAKKINAIKKEYPHLFQKQEAKNSSAEKKSLHLDESVDQQSGKSDEKNMNVSQSLKQNLHQNERFQAAEKKKLEQIYSEQKKQIIEYKQADFNDSNAPYVIKYNDSGIFVKANQKNSKEILTVIQRALAQHYNQPGLCNE